MPLKLPPLPLAPYLSANRTTRHLNFLICQHRQRSSLVTIVMRARSYLDLGNCPTPRVSPTWYSGWNCRDMVPVFALVQCFPISIGAAPDVLFLMKARTFIFQVVRLNFLYADLRFHRSAVGLLDHSHTGRFDDGAGHRFLLETVEQSL